MHLGTGVVAGALIVFFSVTGALLTYERPIVHAADRRSYAADPVLPGAIPVPLDELLDRAGAVVPAPVDAVTIYQDVHSPVEIETASRDVYFVDPHSGRVQGPVSPRLRAFFAEVTALHRWFGLSNAHHAAAATAVKGGAASLLLFQLVSGALLWQPHRWTRSSLRSGATPRLRARGRARNYNWHKVTGFWLGLPLAIVVITGVIMAFPLANALLFRLAGSPIPVRGGNGVGRRHDVAKHGLPGHLDQAFTQATSNVSGWRSATLRLVPATPGLNFTVDRADGGHPEQREQVSIDPKTLEVRRREPFDALSRGQQWRSWVRFAHTGEAGGWWGETLALVTASGAAMLSITGIALSFDRLRRWQRRMDRRQIQAPACTEGSTSIVLARAARR
jgi:uncharacterized iron-regulated membrane protein